MSAFADVLCMDEAKGHLNTILAQESAADSTLSKIAEEMINDVAAEYDEAKTIGPHSVSHERHISSLLPS